MDTSDLNVVDDFKLDFNIEKPDFNFEKPMCRCCLSTDRRMFSALIFDGHMRDLAGINISDSDGLPRWICWECAALLRKAIKFKLKVLRAHTMLYEYLTRCAPFPLDAQDPELATYASPHLCATTTLSFDNGKGKRFPSVLEHDKQVQNSELDIINIPLNKVEEEPIKEETGFSDIEDNMTLVEFRVTTNKTPEDALNKLLEDKLRVMKEETEVKKKKKIKKKVDKVKKKKSSSKRAEADKQPEPKKSIRMPVELDPNKIRVVMLNPEEQIKEREEESKTRLKFPFQCHLCFKGFNFEVKLQNHMKKHSPSRGPFECALCHMHLPSAYSRSVHARIHTRRYECVACGRRMIDRNSILDHYRSQHEGLMTLYTCQICGKISNNSKTHRGHLRNHHSGDRPKCDQCGKTFVNSDSLTEHQQIHQGIKNYECALCGAKFRTRAQIKHHQLKHSAAKDYYCVECDTRFKSSHSLRQHLQKSLKHKDVESLKYPCTGCHKRFESERAAAAHARVQHDGVRAHACPQCGAALASRNSLNKHVQTVHAGRRPPPRHVCDTCGKAFRGKSVLINHVRTHTGEKPFSCEVCGRCFSQRTAARTHLKLVHLKIRRSAKIKPEIPTEARDPKLDMFPKHEPPIVFDTWNRQPIQTCDTFFHVTAGP